MTTPAENHKRRDPIRLREVIVGVVLIVLSVYSIVLGIRLDHQRSCLENYIEANSATSAVRSDQVEKESQATRTVILALFNREITTDEAFDRLGDGYKGSLAKVDKARAENPVQRFDPDRCTRDPDEKGK